MENEELEEIVDEEPETLDDELANYKEAITFKIDDSWPDEVKQQVEQLNQMSAIINEKPNLDDEPEELSDDDDDDDDDDEDEEDEEESVDNGVSTEETETFSDLF